MEQREGSARRKRNWLRALILGAGCILGIWGALALWPYPELEAFRKRSYGLVLQDRNGLVLRVFPADDGVRREWAELEEFPVGVVKIFLRAEDRRFYFHGGVDPLAVLGSAGRNLRAGRIVSGASTITMQLARLIRPRPGVFGESSDAPPSCFLLKYEYATFFRKPRPAGG